MSSIGNFEITLDCSHDEAIERATAALQEHGFGVLTRIDMHDAFKQKLDVEFRPYTILGACNPSLAHLAVNAAPEVGLLLPCNVTVEQAEGGSRVRIVDPDAMLGVGDLPKIPGIAEVARDARQRLREVAEALESV